MTIHVSNLDLLCFMIAERLRKMQSISGMDLLRQNVTSSTLRKKVQTNDDISPIHSELGQQALAVAL